MGWINSLSNSADARNTLYNSTILIDNTNLAKMLNEFDGIFDSIVNFTSEVSNLFLSPISIPKKYSEDQTLITSRGTFSSVKINKPDFDDNKCSYYYLGSYYYAAPDYTYYKGYTQIRVYLPYYGWFEIDPNEVSNSYISFRLMLDLSSGVGTYMIGTTSVISGADPTDDDSVTIIATYNAQILIELPLGQSNIGDIKRNLAISAIAAAASIGATVTTAVPISSGVAGSSAAVSGSLGAGSASAARLSSTTLIPASSRAVGSVGGFGGYGGREAIDLDRLMSGVRPQGSGISGTTIDIYGLRNASQVAQLGVANAAMSSVSGRAEKCTSPMSYSQMTTNIHVVIVRPNFADSSSYYNTNSVYGKTQGYPLGRDQGSLAVYGYTEVSNIRLENEGFAQATSAEIAAIAQIMRGGVIFPDPPESSGGTDADLKDKDTDLDITESIK